MEDNLVVSVIGLGYVGLPVAVAFGEKYKVIGFDINASRINELRNGVDRTNEVTSEELKATKVYYTSDAKELEDANFHIIAVPTPISSGNQPDMSIVYAASRAVGKNLKPGSIVVYESTVYPGATEEDCVPILEEESGLKCGVDFKVGYSPERINPGDREHRFTTIKKVVSGQDDESLEKISQVYGSVVTAGVHRAPSIKVAEASKVIENTQRDINVAFMNELSKIFHLLDINTNDVLEAARTKWNFLPFHPGLVGGHCIGVDPFYLTHKAQKVGYHPEVILAGRRINDNMGYYVARIVTEDILRKGGSTNSLTVNVLGLGFKENCPDIRNTRVLDIVRKLQDLSVDVNIYDPLADSDEIKECFGTVPTPLEELPPADALVVAVPHKEIKEMEREKIMSLMKTPKVLVDVRGAFRFFADDEEVKYWSL